MKKQYTYIFLFLFLTFSYNSLATHIRAGEIIIERISVQSLTYRISVIGYTDTESDVTFGAGLLEFGDGTSVILRDGSIFNETINLGNNVAYNIFVIEHTFPANGQFIIRYTEQNRNAGVLNMANSVETPFYIQTKILIDQFLGLNSTPILLIPPIDRAATGATFFHNPGAFDPDGDSLAYRIVLPRQSVDLPVNDHTFPNDQRHYPNFNYDQANEAKDGQPTYTLDQFTGDLVWDAPGSVGEYNVAFVVEEWRKVGGEWNLIGCVTRDMQIIVEDTDNERPELAIPRDTCIVAGETLVAQIRGEDPDGHNVILESFSGVYNLNSSPATYSPNPPVISPSPALLDFNWETNCNHVRKSAYPIQFKVTDVPPALQRPALANFETWNVTVIAPAPTGLTATVLPGREIQLNWDNYTCENAAEMQIYRRVDSFEYEPGYCETGIPQNGGYELIGNVNISNRSFLDDNDGLGLSPGATFCYRLVALFPNPDGSESIVSEEVCTEILADAPVITNVSIEKTDPEEGEVIVSWRSPFQIDESLFPPPYTYHIARADGFNGRSGLTTLGTTTDTTFTDIGLNTQDNVYNYRIYLFDDANNLIDSSAVASTVRLTPSPKVGEITLSWQADVPWSNIDQEFPYHYIYRNQVNPGNPERLVLIDSVKVTENGFNYQDNGSFNGLALSDQLVYCYFVTTQGSYGNPLIEAPLLNKSQVVCVQPNDTIPPCVPVNLVLSDCEDLFRDQPCNNDAFINQLQWEADDDPACQNDIASYNIYFSPNQEVEFVLKANVTALFFEDNDLNGLGGCYKVSAIDRSGNESELSETICVTDLSNCLYYELPNVFTPNGDGLNDTFEAFKCVPGRCPKFVKKVVLNMFNRLGKKVYEYSSEGENDIFVNWNGRSSDGRALSSGVYYYEAEITYQVLDPAIAKQQIKGWVHLLR